MKLEYILVSPHTSEKAYALQDSASKYVLRVHPDATKIEVKQAVTKFFGVKPKSVQMMVVRKKERHLNNGRTLTKRPQMKKAMVTFPKGTKMDLQKVV